MTQKRFRVIEGGRAEAQPEGPSLDDPRPATDVPDVLLEFLADEKRAEEREEGLLEQDRRFLEQLRRKG
jgi:hypothetical protein